MWAIVPYFLFAWLLLSVILFVQQAGRFSDIFFSANIPQGLIWQLAIALIPNVIAFTCPMAVLVGTVIGLSKMQGDNEIVAIRSAGVGNIQILIPVMLLGVLLTGFTFIVNLWGVPLAARIVRTVALQTAIYKLESPIEPGVFNTEVNGYTIYVKDGDLTDGSWRNIFIHTKDPNTGDVRLITSKQGRIDTSDQISELVLQHANSTTITPNSEGEKFVTESIGEVRIAIRTRRNELIEKISSSERSAEEMGLSQLSDFARGKEGSEKAEAEILWQRRILLSVAPLLFCLLGTALVLRFDRGGRGFGVFLSLMGLITFYLLAFLGEQLARTQKVSALAGSLLPGFVLIVVSILLLYSRRSFVISPFQRIPELTLEQFTGLLGRFRARDFFIDITTGIRDFDILRNLFGYYVLALSFLAAIFLIFTAFELWRFAGNMPNGVTILIQYLIFLIPFIYLQLSPSSAMIATLATYIIKSRQNEIVTWTAAGQSVYRLLFPCFAAMIGLGIFNFAVQELIAPYTNVRQDAYRQTLRSRGKLSDPSLFWVAEGDRIFSFIPVISASDNEKAADNVTIYEFADNGGGLQALYRSDHARFSSGKIVFDGDLRTSRLDDGTVVNRSSTGGELAVDQNPFKEIRRKPSQMTLAETGRRILSSESDVERRSFESARARKWSTLILPFIIALFTAPFALSLDRKGKVVTVGYAVGLWLLFMGMTSAFEQFGSAGSLSPSLAVWGPLVIFALFGAVLLTRTRT